MSPGNRRRKDIGDYWLGKTLGRGSSGRVKIGIHKITGEKVAVKIIAKSHLASNVSVEKAVKREIAVMKLINHPNIMSLIDVIDLSDSPNLYLILEYVQGGELFEYLVSQGRLSESEARKYFQQIIFGLDYCHRHLICHRDLKPENLLLDKEKSIKIADFGMASLQPTGSLLETSCGSPHYASPEIVNGIPYDGSASDIWSCGIILYALLSGHLPFDDDNIRQLLNKVKVGKYKMPEHFSDNAKDLIQSILVIDPAKRLTMKQVQEHPWFTIDPPANPSTLPDPPTAEEIGRPVSDASEIDDRILATLKDLWTDLTAENVIEALLNKEYNMQKVTYVLLQRHAVNYWQTERDDDLRTSKYITISKYINSYHFQQSHLLPSVAAVQPPYVPWPHQRNLFMV
ncbi:kinase-like domain-containing protein [Phycomyces nitens]|nr:kinase-like domain-containing protein [Phycomyces nitens]